MLKNETKTIGDYQVTTVQLMARKALKLAGKLGRLVGPALARLPAGLTADSDLVTLAPALAAALEQLEDDAAYDALLLEILQSTQVQRSDRIVPLTSLVAIDATFDADAGALIQTCAFALSVTLKGFSSGLQSGTGALVVQKMKAAGG